MEYHSLSLLRDPVPAHLGKRIKTMEGLMDQHKSPGSQSSMMEEIANRIDSIPDIYKIFDAYVASIAESLEAERGFIMFKRPMTDDLKVYGAYNIKPELVSTTADISQTVINKVIGEKKAVLTIDALKDPRFQDTTSVVISGIHSILCVPVTIKSITRGLVYLDNKLQHSTFKAAHQNLLVSFLSSTEAALDRLYKRVEQVDRPRDKKLPPKRRSGL